MIDVQEITEREQTIAAAVAQLVLARTRRGDYGAVLESDHGDHAGSVATVEIRLEGATVVSKSPDVGTHHVLGTVQDGLDLLEGGPGDETPGVRVETTGLQEGER